MIASLGGAGHVTKVAASTAPLRIFCLFPPTLCFKPRRTWKRRTTDAVSTLCICATLMLPDGAAIAAQPPKALYLQLIETHPAPALSTVSGREYKFLIDPAQTKSPSAAAFGDLWERVKGAAIRRGFEVTEKKGNPLKVERSTKEYFDTRDQALWHKGYLIRITDRGGNGTTPAMASVTVKSIGENPLRTLAAPLTVVGAGKVKTEAEDNVSVSQKGGLGGYVEKSASFSVVLASSAELTLGDFGRYVPELLGLGLSADTIVVSAKAFSERVKPGKVSLPGVGASGISIEAWSAVAGGAPYLFELSFGYSGIDFYAAGETHAAAERFMTDVIGEELGALADPEGARWAGSKVRKLMNRPLSPK